jgi:hypothetical protein
MEVGTFLRPLDRAGVIDNPEAEKAVDLFDRVRVLTWRLMHPKTFNK